MTSNDNWRFVVFTKWMREASIEKLAESTYALGVNGLDILVRDGYHVTPAGAAKELPKVVRELGSFGIQVPILTTDIVDAAEPTTESIIGACRDAGVNLVRLGHWTTSFGSYSEDLDKARKSLAGIERICARYGVKAALQLHHERVHCSASAALRMMQDCDPRYIGAYWDPANLIRGGWEGWDISLDILRDRITCVGIKDAAWFQNPDDLKDWHIEWVPLSHGIIPWKEIFGLLSKIGYSGPISFYGYENTPFNECMDLLKFDVDYLKGTIDDSGHIEEPVNEQSPKGTFVPVS